VPLKCKNTFQRLGSTPDPAGEWGAHSALPEPPSWWEGGSLLPSQELHPDLGLRASLLTPIRSFFTIQNLRISYFLIVTLTVTLHARHKPTERAFVRRCLCDSVARYKLVTRRDHAPFCRVALSMMCYLKQQSDQDTKGNAKCRKCGGF